MSAEESGPTTQGVSAGEFCLVCGDPNLQRLDVFSDNDNWVIHCSACGMEFLQPRPTFEQLQRYYDSYETTKMSDKDFRFLFEESLTYFERFAKNAGIVKEKFGDLKLLEVGFGHGASLLAAATLGFESYGVDLDPVAITSLQARASQYGVKIRCFEGDVTSVESKLSFDLIKASQVIEHTLEPFEFLRELFSRQPAGGRLLIECPNNEAAFWYAKNVLRKRYDRMNFYKSLKLNEHLSGFTDTSIRLMLKQAGYEVIKCQDYPVRDPRFHHENFLWYPTVGYGLRLSLKLRRLYPLLKSFIPVFDSVASKMTRKGTHLAVMAQKPAVP